MGPRVSVWVTPTSCECESVFVASCKRCVSENLIGCERGPRGYLGDTRRLCVCNTMQARRCAFCVGVGVEEARSARVPSRLRACVCMCVYMCVSARARGEGGSVPSAASPTRAPLPAATTARLAFPGEGRTEDGAAEGAAAAGAGAQSRLRRGRCAGPGGRAGRGEGPGPRGGRARRAPSLARSLPPPRALPRRLLPPPPAPPSPGTERARSGAGLASSQQRHGTSPPPLSFSPGEFLGWCVGSGRKLRCLGGQGAGAAQGRGSM